MKDNNVGGPSIIFNRYHEKDKTRIRDAEMTRKNLEPKPCKKVVGYDANALYLWAIMPAGQYTRRLESDGFKKQWSGKMAIEWLEWQAYQQQIKIRHEYNIRRKELELVAFQLMDSVPRHKRCFNFMVRIVKNCLGLASLCESD